MKRAITMLLAVVTLLAVLVIPVSAASNWNSEMAEFKPVSEYYDDYYPKYLWALQRFLFCYSDTQDEMAGSTHDGIWGSKTKAAIGAYQRYTMGDSTPDYIVGSGTWKSISYQLTPTDGIFEGTSVYRLVTNNNWPVFIASKGASPKFVYFYGTGPSATVHTAYTFHPFN